MARAKVVHRCRTCGAQSASWLGRCPGCDEWNTLELVESSSPLRSVSVVVPRALPIGAVESPSTVAVPTGVPEIDRALGGGLHRGSVTLLGGPPGIGKSTLLLQLAAQVAEHRGTVLYVSAEESPSQVRHRAERLGCLHERLLVASDTDLDAVTAVLEREVPEVAVIDSVQTVADASLPSAAGSVVQVRHVALHLSRVAKRLGITLVLVGHVTKDGALAGPRVLEHLVDTVLSFEGDRTGDLRLLRAVKHRFGPTSEVGLFEMTAVGLASVVDASGRFLADRRTGQSGSLVAPTMEGQRSMLVEVQALVAPNEGGSPRRSAQGVDTARLAMLLAVLDRRAGLSTAALDVYVSVAGGARATEPAADLAVALAVASSATDVALPGGLVAIGEIGLAGELRRVGDLDRRLLEAKRLGFHTAAVPAGSEVDEPAAMALHRCNDLSEAVAHYLTPV